MDLKAGGVTPSSMRIHANGTIPKSMSARKGSIAATARIVLRDHKGL